MKLRILLLTLVVFFSMASVQAVTSRIMPSGLWDPWNYGVVTHFNSLNTFQIYVDTLPTTPVQIRSYLQRYDAPGGNPIGPPWNFATDNNPVLPTYYTVNIPWNYEWSSVYLEILGADGLTYSSNRIHVHNVF